jgi:GDP-4-dehydro-6-deoxy-D-mannose reductase
MKSLIIGGAGFVGTYLIRHLKEDLGQEVTVTKMPNETIKAENVSVLDLNILDQPAIEAVLQSVHPDYIFHLAAQSSVSVSWKNPALTIDVNVKGAANLLEAIKNLNYKPRVLLIGSGEEYGHIFPGETPIVEDTIVRPGNIYAATKVCQNLLGHIYAEAYGLQVMMVRAFNHIGPNQMPLFVVADFCKQVAEIEAGQKEAVIKVGNLSAKRDFTDVRDVVRAYALLAQKGIAGECYNVGSGHAIAIEEVLKMIVANSGVPIQVEVDPQKLRPVDVPIIEADITKIVSETGWRPEITLEQTIKETLDYWRNNV